MEAVEFVAEGVVERDVIDDPYFSADGVHFGRHGELGNHGEQLHHDDQEMTRG